jgi:hypothetical protein
LRRSATGSSSRGITTRKAASLFTGAGPGATLAVRGGAITGHWNGGMVSLRAE